MVINKANPYNHLRVCKYMAIHLKGIWKLFLKCFEICKWDLIEHDWEEKGQKVSGGS